MSNPQSVHRVVHVASSLSHLGGGVTVWALARHGRAWGVTPLVVGVLDEFTNRDTVHLAEDIEFHALPPARPRSILYTPGLQREIERLLGEAAVLHMHGLWLYPGYAARSAADRVAKPRVVSPQGMLEPWALERSRVKKRLIGMLYENRNLRTADCLQATAAAEARQFRDLGLKNPIAVVPLGLELDQYITEADPAEVAATWPELAGQKLLLFVSRVHPKKGLPMLAEAWATLRERFPDWRLVIAGPDELGHTQEIRDQLEASGAIARASLLGPVFGREKALLYAAADLFVLPTHSENFGLVVPESLASGVPVITTKGTPWFNLPEHGCGWWIDIGTKPLTRTLDEAMSLSEAERVAMGVRGRALVEREYTAPVVAGKMAEVYRWLAGEVDQPDCVWRDER